MHIDNNAFQQHHITLIKMWNVMQLRMFTFTLKVFYMNLRDYFYQKQTEVLCDSLR